MVEWRSCCTHLCRIVDEGLVGDVVWVDFEFQVCPRIFGAFVYESLHDFVLPDIIVGSLRRIEVKVGLVVGREGYLNIGGRVA